MVGRTVLEGVPIEIPTFVFFGPPYVGPIIGQSLQSVKGEKSFKLNSIAEIDDGPHGASTLS